MRLKIRSVYDARGEWFSGLPFGKRQRYDLPLNKGTDAQFLSFLSALMSFLAVLALSGMFALNALAHQWSSGLEDKLTVEIPIQTTEGHILSQETVRKETTDVYAVLAVHPLVRHARILGRSDIQALVSPWIDNDLALADIPLPGLIAVDLETPGTETMGTLETAVRKVSKHAVLDTHREWLADIIRFTDVLRSFAALIVVAVGAITAMAIAFAVKARLAMHYGDVALLHHMGATDDYIARQFQNHALILVVKGALAGSFVGIVSVASFSFLFGDPGTALLPALHIGGLTVVWLCGVPLAVGMITIVAARVTVLRSLARMP